VVGVSVYTEARVAACGAAKAHNTLASTPTTTVANQPVFLKDAVLRLFIKLHTPFQCRAVGEKGYQPVFYLKVQFLAQLCY
jgi:hypothetical protein